MKRKEKEIKQLLNGFENRFGKSHLYLAYHAALPMSLTPDLLYRIWANFKEDNQGNILDIPYYAVADVLIFLCKEVGYELYEMEIDIRNELLRRLKTEPNLGERRIEELASFLMAYIQPFLLSEDRDEQALAQVQQWTALAYINRQAATSNIAEAFASKQYSDKAELVWMESIVKALSIPLGRESNLVQYAEGMGSYGRGNLEDATDKLMAIPQWGDNLQVAGISLLIPEKIRQSKEWQRRRFFRFALLTILSCGGVVGAYVIYRNLLGVYEIIKEDTKFVQYFTENLGKGVTMDMVAIPGGKFFMGSPATGKGRYDSESPQHEVTIPPFYMGKYEVTQAQWKAIASLPKVDMELKPDPSNFKDDPPPPPLKRGASDSPPSKGGARGGSPTRWDRPVEQVRWDEAVEFCKRLSKVTGRDYRLPSEAEWEYACRSVNSYQLSVISEELAIGEWNQKYNQPFYFGETITGELANYDASNTYADEPKGEYRQQTTPVGQFPPNAFGLYDMHGNVWEWCEDDWHDNYNGAPKDGSAWINNNNNRSQYTTKIIRGGSWSFNPNQCRSAVRLDFNPVSVCNLNIGFRVAVSLPRTS